MNLARRPGVVAERVGSLGRELASIATGTCDRAPAKPDKRFSDPAWQTNPLMKRSVQAYLAAAEFVANLFADAELDWRDAERIRFVLDVVMEGLAPSNNPLISPLGWKAIIDTGGRYRAKVNQERNRVGRRIDISHVVQEELLIDRA